MNLKLNRTRWSVEGWISWYHLLSWHWPLNATDFYSFASSSLKHVCHGASASLCPLNWFCWTSVTGPLQKTSCSLIDPDPPSLWKADLWGQTGMWLAGGEAACSTPPWDVPMRRLWKGCVTLTWFTAFPSQFFCRNTIPVERKSKEDMLVSRKLMLFLRASTTQACRDF